MAGILSEILQKTQLSDSMQERVKLYEKQYAGLKGDISKLKNQVLEQQQKIHELEGQLPKAPSNVLGKDDKRMLVRMFRAQPIRDERPFEPPIAENDLGALANALRMERGVAEYHLERLSKLGLADNTGGNFEYNHSYWDLTEQGRAYVVENELLNEPDH